MKKIFQTTNKMVAIGTYLQKAEAQQIAKLVESLVTVQSIDLQRLRAKKAKNECVAKFWRNMQRATRKSLGINAKSALIKWEGFQSLWYSIEQNNWDEELLKSTSSYKTKLCWNLVLDIEISSIRVLPNIVSLGTSVTNKTLCSSFNFSCWFLLYNLYLCIVFCFIWVSANIFGCVYFCVTEHCNRICVTTNVKRIVYFVVLGWWLPLLPLCCPNKPSRNSRANILLHNHTISIFQLSIPKKINENITYDQKTICNIFLPNKPSTWGLRNSKANVVLHTLAQITKYFQFPSKSIHLIEKLSAEIYLYFHWQGQSLAHSACPTAARIQIFLFFRIQKINVKWLQLLIVFLFSVSEFR